MTRLHLVIPVVASLQCLLTSSVCIAEGPSFATGFKVGEVTDTSAIVWTRLTKNDRPNPADAPMVEIEYGPGRGRNREVKAIKYPEGVTAADIRNAVPGAEGEVRVQYQSDDASAWQETTWQQVDPNQDYTRQFSLEDLSPNTRYRVRVQGRAEQGADVTTIDGAFRTAPAPDDPARVMFTVSTGQAFPDTDRPDGFQIYPTMRAIDPHFFVHTGDIVYYDNLAKNADLARYHWQRTYSLPTNVNFHRQVASYFIKDDHDTLVDDCWPTMKSPFMGDFTFEEGLKIFRYEVPMGEKTYRTRRWGKDLQIWMVEGRDFRSANTLPDGPDKTIWGDEQKKWFKRTVQESDATFRVLISPTPLVGPDRPRKADNHANKAFAHEGSELREFISQQKNMVVVCGDRHWQYMSVHPETGVREYSCGPASDKHAGGWQQSDYRDDYHRFLEVQGGFLSATAERQDGTPTLTFRFHDVDGHVRYEDKLTAD